MQIEFRRKERVAFGDATFFCFGTSLDVVVVVDETFHTTFVAVCLVCVEGQDVYLLIVEHTNGTKVYERFKTPHTRSAYGNYEIFVHCIKCLDYWY
jgi:hypothetical protein